MSRHPRKDIAARRRRRRSNERWKARQQERLREETYTERYARIRDDVILAARVVDRRIPGVLGLVLEGLGVL